MRTGEHEAGSEPTATGPVISFEATNCTGTETVSVTNVQATLPAGAVAAALADKMSLPPNTPWALRDDSRGVFLDDAKSIGEQVAPGAKLTVTPKAHLGG
jgi:hypothetical protein